DEQLEEQKRQFHFESRHCASEPAVLGYRSQRKRKTKAGGARQRRCESGPIITGLLPDTKCRGKSGLARVPAPARPACSRAQRRVQRVFMYRRLKWRHVQ